METTLVTQQFYESLPELGFENLPELGVDRKLGVAPVCDLDGNTYLKFWVAPEARHEEPYWELWKTIHIDERTCELQISRIQICPQKVKI
jgi:hypothetical protein